MSGVCDLLKDLGEKNKLGKVYLMDDESDQLETGQELEKQAKEALRQAKECFSMLDKMEEMLKFSKALYEKFCEKVGEYVSTIPKEVPEEQKQ